MNDLSTPPVPELDARRITANRIRLVREIATPSHRPVSRRLALGGAGALAAVGATTAAVVIAFAGAGAPNAFAGWTATPTRPAGGQTDGALSDCTSQLSGPANAPIAVPAGDWQAVVTDTRGPFTAMIMKSSRATATCLTGPTFTSIAVNKGAGGSVHVMHVGVTSPGAAAPGSSSLSVTGLAGGSAGPISQASEQRLALEGGQPYTIVQGKVADDATGVTLVLSDGSEVQATLGDGELVAWWPGDEHVTSAQVTTPSGVTTQQLTFAPLPAPGSPPPPGAVTSP
jgi:hypothetical protein